MSSLLLTNKESPTIETIAYLVSQREEFMTRYGQFCSCMHDLRNTRPEIQVSRQIFNLVEQALLLTPALDLEWRSDAGLCLIWQMM